VPWYDDLKTPRIKTQVEERVSKVPDGLWTKCSQCSEMLQTKTLKENLLVCPECEHHFRMTAVDRIAMLTDRISNRTSAKTGAKSKSQRGASASITSDPEVTVPAFVEYAEGLVSTDPLEFFDTKPYKDRLRGSAELLGMGDGFVCGKARLGGLDYHLGVFEFKFMGGSMGVVVGEKICRVFEKSLKEKLPAVIVSASGGARMQEGILSLMQMAKTSALVERLRAEGIPYISILTDPTTGGVAASFAMLGDLILGEPKALIGFAGPRVIQQTIRQSLPEGFQRSEFLLQHGFLDRIVPRRQLAQELREWMWRLGKKTCRFSNTAD
jgi:acetyl-CoA carboxylase carboxyl transferase subunit beta